MCVIGIVDRDMGNSVEGNIVYKYLSQEPARRPVSRGIAIFRKSRI